MPSPIQAGLESGPGSHRPGSIHIQCARTPFYSTCCCNNTHPPNHIFLCASPNLALDGPVSICGKQIWFPPLTLSFFEVKSLILVGIWEAAVIEQWTCQKRLLLSVCQENQKYTHSVKVHNLISTAYWLESAVDPFWATMWQTNPWSQQKPSGPKMCSRHRFCEKSKEQEREILAVDVKRRRSDLFHNLSCFYRCHIWTRHFPGREFSWDAISSLSWRKASFPQMAGGRPAPRLIATFCLMLRTSRELAVTSECQKFEKNTNSRQVSLRSAKQSDSILCILVLS